MRLRQSHELLPAAHPDFSVVDQDSDGYAEGFDDAMSGEALFDDASAEYRCGWLAWWDCHRLFEAAGYVNVDGIWRHLSTLTQR